MKKITDDEILFYQNTCVYQNSQKTAGHVVSYFNLNFKNRTQKKLSLQN